VVVRRLRFLLLFYQQHKLQQQSARNELHPVPTTSLGEARLFPFDTRKRICQQKLCRLRQSLQKTKWCCSTTPDPEDVIVACYEMQACKWCNCISMRCTMLHGDGCACCEPCITVPVESLPVLVRMIARDFACCRVCAMSSCPKVGVSSSWWNLQCSDHGGQVRMPCRIAAVRCGVVCVSPRARTHDAYHGASQPWRVLEALD
jgi:hypothetical protein